MNEFKNCIIGKIRSFRRAERIKNQKGATIILVALLMLALIGFAALAIDVGYYMVTRNELQNIADGSALAACRVLGEIYRNMPLADQSSYVFDPTDTTTDPPSTALITNALSIGTSNKAGGIQGITIDSGDVIIGTWDGNSLTPTLNQPDAVRVIARRDGSANGPISTFLARVLGIDTVGVRMDAIAALTGQSTSEPGELELPIGISRYFFEDGNACNDWIVFNPTNDPDSCAGWNSYDISPPNDNQLRDILDVDGDVVSPGTIAGETDFNFIGGNLSNPTFDELLLLFMEKGYDIDSSDPDTGNPVLIDGDGNPIPGHVPLGTVGYEGRTPVPYDEEGVQAYYPDDNQNPTPRNWHRWETSVVVYDWDDCSNPNTAITIVGYAKISIHNVQQAPEKRVEGKVVCQFFSDEFTRGGGGEFGIKGTIPGLVE
jgi:Flp pilus assembly protein TadG